MFAGPRTCRAPIDAAHRRRASQRDQGRAIGGNRVELALEEGGEDALVGDRRHGLLGDQRTEMPSHHGCRQRQHAGRVHHLHELDREPGRRQLVASGSPCGSRASHHGVRARCQHRANQSGAGAAAARARQRRPRARPRARRARSLLLRLGVLDRSRRVSAPCPRLPLADRGGSVWIFGRSFRGWPYRLPPPLLSSR